MATKDQERQAREQALYLQVLNGDNAAAVTLYQNATGADGDNNPAITRQYAQQYIQQLAKQGISVSDAGILTSVGIATLSNATGGGQVGSQSVAGDPVSSAVSSVENALGISTSATATAAATPAGASTATPGLAVGVQQGPGLWIAGGALIITVFLAWAIGGAHRR
jgi:hypothetical protein